MEDDRTEGDVLEELLPVPVTGEIIEAQTPEALALDSFPARFPETYRALYEEIIDRVNRETLALPEFGMLHEMTVQRIAAVWIRLHAADNAPDGAAGKKYKLNAWEYRDLSNIYTEMSTNLLKEGREILRDQPYREELATALMIIINDEIPEQFDLKRRILLKLRDWVAGRANQGRGRPKGRV